jgi:hypothetical protein
LAYGGPVDQLFLAFPEQANNGIIHDAGPAQQSAGVDQRRGRQADKPASPFDPVLVEALNGRAFSHYPYHNPSNVGRWGRGAEIWEWSSRDF